MYDVFECKQHKRMFEYGMLTSTLRSQITDHPDSIFVISSHDCHRQLQLLLIQCLQQPSDCQTSQFSPEQFQSTKS